MDPPLGVLHSVFDLAIEKGWARENPVKRVAKPEDDGHHEIRFLSTIEELEAVLLAVPDDVLGSIEATLYLTAARPSAIGTAGAVVGEMWIGWRASSAGPSRLRSAETRDDHAAAGFGGAPC